MTALAKLFQVNKAILVQQFFLLFKRFISVLKIELARLEVLITYLKVLCSCHLERQKIIALISQKLPILLFFEMSRYSQDILGLIRGIQLVANASVKTQEAYLKHLWSHSSVRDAIEKSAAQTSECGKKTVTNPGQELQNVGNILKETFERSSVVVEGIRQYTASGRTTFPIGEIESVDGTKSYSTIKNIKNLDIASITLNELENLLTEHNKMRQVKLRLGDEFKPKVKKPIVKAKPEPVEVPPEPLKPKIEPTASVAKDEKQVENVMKFITNYDREATSSLKGDMNSSVPEVSSHKTLLTKAHCALTKREGRYQGER